MAPEEDIAALIAALCSPGSEHMPAVARAVLDPIGGSRKVSGDHFGVALTYLHAEPVPERSSSYWKRELYAVSRSEACSLALVRSCRVLCFRLLQFERQRLRGQRRRRPKRNERNHHRERRPNPERAHQHLRDPHHRYHEHQRGHQHQRDDEHQRDDKHQRGHQRERRQQHSGG